MIRRCVSKMRCQQIALAMPVSSSTVRKVTVPVPGRWRMRTMPATWTLSPSLSSLSPAAGDDAASLQVRTQEGDRMGAQRKLHGAIILDHLAPVAERRQHHFRLPAPRVGRGEERQRRAAEPAHPPQRLPPVEAERSEGVGVGELLQRRGRHSGAQPDVLDRDEGRVHRGRGDPRAMVVGETLHHAQTQAEREELL